MSRPFEVVLQTYTNCTHALYNVHHLRELEGVWEEDNKQQWAKEMKTLLEEINRVTNDAGGMLRADESEKYRQRYREILQKAEVESPPPDETNRKGKRGQRPGIFWNGYGSMRMMY